MPIIKTKSSTYLSKDSKLYICECGDQYYTKYRDYDCCLWCAKRKEDELQKKIL